MFGRDVGHVIGNLYQLLESVVGLSHDGLVCLGDVVLETYHVLKPQRPAHLGGDFHRLVVDRVAPVEADEGRAPVLAGEELGADQGP